MVIKRATVQKGDSNKSAADPYLKVTSEKKSTTTGTTPIKAAGTESQNGTSLNFTKIGDIKWEKDK